MGEFELWVSFELWMTFELLVTFELWLIFLIMGDFSIMGEGAQTDRQTNRQTDTHINTITRLGLRARPSEKGSNKTVYIMWSYILEKVAVNHKCLLLISCSFSIVIIQYTSA